MKDFKLSTILALLAESPRGWKHQGKKDRDSDGATVSSVLMCNNFQDAQLLNGLILQKVKTLKTVENIYIKDSWTVGRSAVIEDDTYSEVFDTLNSHPPPPPLPSRRCSPTPPARPPYPSHLRRTRLPRTV